MNKEVLLKAIEVYVVLGYFKYEGSEVISVCSTMERAIDVCKRYVKGWDGTVVERYTLDTDIDGVEVHIERNRL
jgi:hypothetical protein